MFTVILLEDKNFLMIVCHSVDILLDFEVNVIENDEIQVFFINF